MVYKFSYLRDNNKESIIYLSADNENQLYRRALSTYGITKDRIKILSEYKPNNDLNSITLVKNHEKANTYSQKVKDKVDQIYSKLTRRCGQHKIDYINRYSFTEIPIESKNDLYPLVSKYKRVKVYFEPGDKRGTKKLYALVKN